MAERKVLNKYFPADLDPSRKLPRGDRVKKTKADSVRMMLPFSIRCLVCGGFMGAGTKFNATKEHAEGMDYLGVRRFRFRFKCSQCKSSVSILTDPKNASYQVESGAKANSALLAKQEDVKEAEAKEKEPIDSIALLENRTIESKREMDALNELEKLRQRNRIRATVNGSNVMNRAVNLIETERDGNGADIAETSHLDDSKAEDNAVRDLLIEKQNRARSEMENAAENVASVQIEKNAAAEEFLSEEISHALRGPIIRMKKRKLDSDPHVLKSLRKAEDNSMNLLSAYASSSDDDIDKD